MRLTPSALSAALLLAGPVRSQQEYCRSDRGKAGNGYHYEIWIQFGTPGTACLTVYGTEARFKNVWDMSGVVGTKPATSLPATPGPPRRVGPGRVLGSVPVAGISLDGSRVRPNGTRPPAAFIYFLSQ